MIERLEFTDPWVQEMLWSYLNPQDIHWSLSKFNALKVVEQDWSVGGCYFLGDKSQHYLIRVVVRNPFVIEPHIMGDGRKFRSALREGIPLGFVYGAEKINIYTQYPVISRIAQKFGFASVAKVPASHLQDGRLVDIEVLTLTKEDYEQSSNWDPRSGG